MLKERTRPGVRWGLVGLILAGWAIGSSARAQTSPIQPTEKPLLWRIEGPVSSYLYGTIHIPDQRVLALPAVVTRAMNASDAVYTEVVLDQDTLSAAAGAGQLPDSQDLRKIVGDEVFARLVKIVVHALGNNVPPGVDAMMASVLARQTPIAAMSQLVLLDYLPDLLAGRLPLDLMLHNEAVKAGKETGGIETLEEQTDVLFNGLPIDEQAKMLVAAIDEVQHQKPGENPVRHLVDLYLAGDLEPLAAELNKQDREEAALEKQFQSRLIDDRNVKMADRIAARCRDNKTRSYFFAVGAAHYSGETGILAQLARKGFKVTRLTNADAGSIARKPAA
jgi:uncharacterized protein YbaP (TraB family)